MDRRVEGSWMIFVGREARMAFGSVDLGSRTGGCNGGEMPWIPPHPSLHEGQALYHQVTTPTTPTSFSVLKPTKLSLREVPPGLQAILATRLVMVRVTKDEDKSTMQFLVFDW